MRVQNLLTVPLLLTTLVAAQAQVADTTFSVRRGHHAQPFDLVVSTATPGATVRYTLDCSDPTTSTRFAEGLDAVTVRIDPQATNAGLRPLTPAVVVRAYAYKTGMTRTNVDTQTYIFVDRVLVQTRPTGFPSTVAFDMDQAVVNAAAYSGRIRDDLRGLPSMSVVADHTRVFGSSGLLFASQGTIEVPGSIEIMHLGGRDDQVDCGLTPHSWIQLKRSMRVYFRDQYGADKWRHDLFRDAVEGHAVGVGSFDGLVLRAGFNDGLLYGKQARAGRYSFMVDELGRSSQLAMTGWAARGLFVHLYLNGLYWGLYNPIERPESGYWSDWFGGSKTDYFARNHGGPLDGSPTWFNGLISGANTWATVLARLDVPAFCDYILYWTFCGGGDWPSTSGGNNNWYAGNRTAPAGKVRFFVWDCEDSWINLPNRPGSPLDGARICRDLLNGAFDISILWRGVQAVADFRLAFADRVYKHCYNDGALSEAAILARFDGMASGVDHGVVGESARWGRFDPRGVTWTRDGDWVPYTNAIRAMFVANTQQLVAALRNTSVPSPHPPLYPAFEPPLFQTNGQTIEVTEAWVAPGQQIDLARSTAIGWIYYTLAGGDPRGPNGTPVGTNGGTGASVTIPADTVLKARIYDGAQWSALHELTLRVRQGLPAIEIHEVLAENTAGRRDEAGEFDDWIELRNRGLLPVSLAGYHLSDDPAVPTKWTVPSGASVPAGGSVLVWADNEGAEGPLHANFRLSGQGETVVLAAPGGAPILDRVDFGAQRDDVSFGRLETEPSLRVHFARPTPLRANRPNPCGHVSYGALDHAANPLVLQGKGVPSPGDGLRYDLEGLAPSTPAALAFGVAPAHVDIPGLGTVLCLPLVFLAATADPDGEARFAIPLPDAPHLRGAVAYAQGVAALGSSARLSNGVCSRVSQ